MIFNRADAPVFNMALGAICTSFSGMGPTLDEGRSRGFYFLQALTLPRWLVEAFYDQEASIFNRLFYMEEAVTELYGFTLQRFLLDIAVAVALGFGYRVVALVFMVYFTSAKTR